MKKKKTYLPQGRYRATKERGSREKKQKPKLLNGALYSGWDCLSRFWEDYSLFLNCFLTSD